jgi:uncharacterized protein (DUF1501 family)
MTQSRRSFLKSATLLSMAPTVPGFVTRTAAAAAPKRDKHNTVLIVLQLSGGNDGLNTLVPYEDDVYARSRPTLRMKPSEVHKIGGDLGFHPKMPKFERLLKDGDLSVVQGVGYPNNNRNHPGAMRDWHTAAPGEGNVQTGWLGRAVDHAGKTNYVPGMFVGPIATPFAMHSEETVIPSIRSIDQAKLRSGRGGSAHRQTQFQATSAKRADGNSLLQFVQRTALGAYAGSERIEKQSPRGDYPSSQLAKDFQTVAQLIRADLGIRIFFTELGWGGIGGFDNHANQRGNHGALLRELSESIAALVADLKSDKAFDRVLLMTFSEFGRTVTENGRRGTGHGAAQPVFLASGAIKGGLIGTRPDLTDLDNDAPKHHTDFRRVYATALERWLGFDSEPILGKRYESVDVFA